MIELTPEDREQIQHQIVQYKEQKLQEQKNTLPVAPPSTPDGQNANEDLEAALKEGANPDKKEARRVKKRIKGIWNNWRTITLDAKALEQEKIACQIAIARAETQAKLDKIRREEEVAETQHWLELNKGNLEEIDANTTSKPHKAWYNLRRFCHHITKITDNVPKVFKNLFWIGVVIVGIILIR